jgi:polyisoprenoid-binding protein YceI
MASPSTPTAATAASAYVPSTGSYDIDASRTTVLFTTRHLFGMGRVKGRFRLLKADLVIGDRSSRISAVIDAASFESGNASRDAVVHSAKLLDTAAYPHITFESEDIRLEDGAWVASGTVTAHGTPAPADLVLRDVNDASDELTLHASARIDRYAHGVDALRGAAGRWLMIDISAVATRID